MAQTAEKFILSEAVTHATVFILGTAPFLLKNVCLGCDIAQS
jgi:hypothetical protein